MKIEEVLRELRGCVRKGLAYIEQWPGNRAVLFREGKLAVRTSAANLPQQFFPCRINDDWIAADSIQRFDLLIATKLCENLTPPARIGGQSQQAHECGPHQSRVCA